MTDTENNALLKTKIKNTAAYITAAVLLIVLTFIGRKIDAAYFSAVKPFKPAEMTAEAALTAFAAVFAVKYRKSGIMKRISKHVLYIVVPFVMVLSAFFCIPDNLLPASHNMIHILDVLLSALSEDLVLCALGCIFLIHKSGLKKSAVIIMLCGMALYEIALSDETSYVLLISVAAVVILGFFEIQLHLSAESALFCAAYHFLVHLSIKLPALNTTRDGPIFGRTVSNVLYAAALLTMLVSGIILYVKRRRRDAQNDK